MDVLVLTTMKNAAKCDTKSELQNPVNLYVFERMLRFRVLLEACLFECLFSPLAFCSLRKMIRGLWSVAPTSVGASTQVERRRELIQALNERSLQPTWCIASAVQNFGDLGSPRSKRATPDRPFCRHPLPGTNNNSTFGPQIRQEDPLNLSI